MKDNERIYGAKEGDSLPVLRQKCNVMLDLAEKSHGMEDFMLYAKKYALKLEEEGIINIKRPKNIQLFN